MNCRKHCATSPTNSNPHRQSRVQHSPTRRRQNVQHPQKKKMITPPPRLLSSKPHLPPRADLHVGTRALQRREARQNQRSPLPHPIARANRSSQTARGVEISKRRKTTLTISVSSGRCRSSHRSAGQTSRELSCRSPSGAHGGSSLGLALLSPPRGCELSLNRPLATSAQQRSPRPSDLPPSRSEAQEVQRGTALRTHQGTLGPRHRGAGCGRRLHDSGGGSRRPRMTSMTSQTTEPTPHAFPPRSFRPLSPPRPPPRPSRADF
mmetsp:Transcript_2124/g.4985  ORF Transcript_2124/g.4985 Transcript_2124/m.4985 type:complete len:264 (+) Transcript_2124:434-1225(+)